MRPRLSRAIRLLIIFIMVCSTLPARARRSAYLQHVSSAISEQVNGAEVRLLNDSIHVLFPRHLMFDRNEAGVRPDLVPVLKRLGAVLVQYPKTEILIVGHTDALGTAEQNFELSRRRADSVLAMLSAFGVSAARLSAWGLGSSLPVATNATESGRQRNRRVEFIVLLNYRDEPSDQ